MKELKQLVGPKPTYPLVLDFGSTEFQLETADFLLNASNVFKEIDFTSNSLVDCSNSFEHLSKLKRLIIDRNALCDIQFKGLASLVTLSLADNRLNYLNDMGDLRKLVNLNLSGNKLTAGFDQIAKCKALRVLDLGSNNIDFSLSQFWRSFRFLKTLPKLNWLSFEGNACEQSIPYFREFIAHELPKLSYLDWKPITREERSEATKLAAKGIWKDKDSLAELRKAKTSGVLATVGTSPGSSRIDPSPRNFSGQMLEELLGLEDEDETHHAAGDAKRGPATHAHTHSAGSDADDGSLEASKRANDQLDNILEFLDQDGAPLSAADNEDPSLGSGLSSTASSRASVASATDDRQPAAAAGGSNYLEMFYSMLNAPNDPSSSSSSSSSVSTRLVQTGGTIRRLEERTNIPTIRTEPQDDTIFNLLDQIIENKSSAPTPAAAAAATAAVPPPVPQQQLSVAAMRSSVRKSQIQDFAELEKTLNVLETSFADEERERQQKIEEERAKLRQLEVERQQLLAQRELEKRLTMQKLRDEQARRLEEERKRYEDEVRALQEQRRKAHEEAERLRHEVQQQQQQQQQQQRLLAEQKRKQSDEEEAAQQHQQQQQQQAHAAQVGEKADRLSRSSRDDALLANLQPFYCRYEDLQIGQKLGLGSVGVTHRGILNSRQVAIKKFHCPTFSEALVKKLRDEAPQLSLLKHGNLVEFVALCVDTEICSVTEWIEGANLYGYLRNSGNVVGQEWPVKMALQIAQALEYLHAHGVVHGSLKSRDVLLDRDGSPHVTDYGLLPAKLLALSSSPAAVSSCYVAPEADVYSYGILLWELFTRAQPFAGLQPHQIKEAVIHYQRPPVPLCPFVLGRLMQACWHDSVKSRPSFAVIVKILSQPLHELLRYDPKASPAAAAAAATSSGGSSAHQQRVGQQEGGNGGALSEQTAREIVAEKRHTVVDRIADMINSANPQFQLKAVKAISTFATEEGNREAMVESGELLPRLLRLCSAAEEVLREQALRSLASLAEDDYCVTKIAEKGGLASMAAILASSEPTASILLQALHALARLSRTLENIEAVGELGAVDSLVRLLAHPNNELLQMQALVALGLVLGYEGNQVHFYRADGVKPLIKLLGSPNPGIQLRVLEVLAVLANNDKMELIIKRVGVLRRLVPLIQSKSPLLKLQALQSVAKFSSRQMEESGVVEALVGVYADPLWADNREVLLNTTSSLAHFVLDLGKGPGRAAREFPSGRLTNIVPFLITGFADVKVELVKCLSHILQSEARRGEFLGLQGLPRLFQALASDATNDDLQLYGLLALVALAGEGEEIREAIGKAGIIEHMAEDTLTSNHEDVQRHSLHLCAILSGQRDLKERFAATEAVAHLASFVDSPHDDMREHALLTLANLADNERCRAACREEEGLAALLTAFERAAPEPVLECVVGALAHFAGDGCQRDLVELGLSAIIRHASHPKLAIQSLALKSLLLLLKKPENRPAIEAAGGEEKLRALTTSTNRAVAAASAHALQLLHSS
ncbi:Armadillo/betacatenin-like repeat domain containing protein [Acanthamoeba castellanii str. Neff]|uniref:non-specific serine/threonine protein kinase n=1 Tax=Acanthamoeba castellanii (strain ATCC 30010 / Neff) TaxID=1257118 RepID=L8H190_ACACF|nr:Armadillo/betacatenin-like repeat domain containing protein [Acanthamoeba castellanii str. Neff]ELR18987.1 Armadillo/betacatenin-like repeat domain containing protein [Acanthamoeba castellanii str. Neff]